MLLTSLTISSVMENMELVKEETLIQSSQLNDSNEEQENENRVFEKDELRYHIINPHNAMGWFVEIISSSRNVLSSTTSTPFIVWRSTNRQHFMFGVKDNSDNCFFLIPKSEFWRPYDILKLSNGSNCTNIVAGVDVSTDDRVFEFSTRSNQGNLEESETDDDIPVPNGATSFIHVKSQKRVVVREIGQRKVVVLESEEKLTQDDRVGWKPLPED